MSDTANRELAISKLLNVPISKVWEAWTDPTHSAVWWGPTGFTSTVEKMDVTPGGEWIFMMHGPDGTSYPNKSVFLEVVPQQKIVFEHMMPHFITTVTFEAQGDKTQMNWIGLFDSEEILQGLIKAVKADEGLKQNVEKLENYLTTM